MLSLIQRAQQTPDRQAIMDPSGSYSYQMLLADSRQLALRLLEGKPSLDEARIGFMMRPGYDYVVTQWAIWRAGGIAVPIAISYPPPSVRYVLEDAAISGLVATDEFRMLLEPMGKAKGMAVLAPQVKQALAGELPEVPADGRAMMLYTSGTTGKPKGVVSRHSGIEAQIQALVQAWAWEPGDHILNILPLHHVHGIINVLSCALWSGACCEFLPAFSPQAIFETFLKRKVNLFMAVPTIYYKLIAYWEKLDQARQGDVSSTLTSFRLMVSGSAALPVSTLEKWRQISGHTLLERYGMTEMGMAISNPYAGERRPGYIGQPLPGVQIRLVDEQEALVPEGTSGEIQVKGPNVFQEYWNKPEATANSFTKDGWFRTGDIAALENGSYRILGRNSVDIIKSGGYKISALEIEEVLRKHPGIKDCAVVGIPDDEWGELVGAGLVITGNELELPTLKFWVKERLPAYKIPRTYLILSDLPRNVMGKVTKNALKDLFQSKDAQI